MITAFENRNNFLYLIAEILLFFSCFRRRLQLQRCAAAHAGERFPGPDGSYLRGLTRCLSDAGHMAFDSTRVVEGRGKHCELFFAFDECYHRCNTAWDDLFCARQSGCSMCAFDIISVMIKKQKGNDKKATTISM